MVVTSDEDFLAPPPVDPVKPGEPEPKVKVRVADWTQVNLDGKVYKGGAEVSAPKSVARSWIDYGWATPIAAIAKAGSVKGSDSKRK